MNQIPMNQFPQMIRVLMLGVLLQGALLGAETVGIFADTSVGQTDFAAGDVKTALQQKGFVVDLQPLSALTAGYANKKVVIALAGNAAVTTILTGQGGTIPSGLSEQAYSIQTTTAGGRTSYWVLGGDSNGAMYGGLQVAEYIQLNNFGPAISEKIAPRVLKRGAKLNVPLDARLPTYAGSSDFHPSARFAVKSAWSLPFWKDWIDQQARNRNNLLSVWVHNPFPALVTVPGFERGTLPYIIGPDGSGYEDKTLTISKRIQFWKDVMTYARARGLSFYFANWNVWTDYAGTVYPELYAGLDNRAIALASPVVLDYLNKAINQLLITYPDLDGFIVSPGDNLAGDEVPNHTTKNAQWMFDAYNKGLSAFAAANPSRTVNFIHRQINVDLVDTKRLWAPVRAKYPNIQFDYSLKYCRGYSYSTPTPIWEKGDLEDIKESGESTYLTIRNDGFFYHDYGDPQFMRDLVGTMPVSIQLSADPHPGKPLLRGIYFGADTYTPMHSYFYRDDRLNNKDDGSNTPMLDINRRWYMEAISSRVAFDPNVNDSAFKILLNQRFPQLDRDQLFEAWTKASRPVAKLQELVMGDWYFDMHFFRELCINKDGDKFRTIDEFATTAVANGSESRLASIAQTAAGSVKSSQKGADTLADEIESDSDRVLALIKGMDSAGSVRASALISHLKQQAYLNYYYAYKVRGAIYKKKNTTASIALAQEAMGKAYGWYVLYIKEMDDMYKPDRFRSYDLSGGWGSFLSNVLKEFTDLGGSGTPTLPSIPAYGDTRITSPGVVSVVDRQPFSYQITASGSPSSFAATDLPSGLSFDPATGKVTGTLVMAGTTQYSFRVSASYATRGISVSKQVTVTITEAAGNTAPSISGANLPDKTVAKGNALAEDTVYSGTFTISDVQTTNPANLILSVTSSNPSLLPTRNVVLTFVSGNKYSLTATPEADMVGIVKVFVVVSDGFKTADTDFQVEWTPVNDAPRVLNPIPDQSATVGTPFSYTVPIDTFMDVENGTLTWSATGSPANVVFSPATRVFSGTPTAAGTATVRVTVSDGSQTVYDEFLIAVASSGGANLPPTITAIADLTTNEDTSTSAIPFTVGDDRTAVGSLTVTTASSNITLVPNTNVVLGGSGANRTVTVTPAANQSGTSTITVTVSDGSLSFSEPFTLTVTAVNDAPVVANPITDKTATVGLTFNYTAPASTFTDVDNATLTWSASGMPAGITFTPATRKFSGPPTTVGESTVTVTATDGLQSVDTTFKISVSAGTPPIPSKPDAPTAVVSGNSITVSGVTTTGGEIVHIFDNGTEVTSFPSGADGTWSYTITGLSAGEHRITVKYQNAGGTSESSNPTTVTVAGGGTAPVSDGGGGEGGGCGLGSGVVGLLAGFFLLFRGCLRDDDVKY